MQYKEFCENIDELQRYYKQELNETELKIWYENLKFMTIDRFKYIIAEIYNKNKFMPKLAEIIELHKSLGYTTINETITVQGNCKKCGNTGYVTYKKIIQNMPYTFVAICNCGRQKKYDGTKCIDPKNKSQYYTPLLAELGLEN